MKKNKKKTVAKDVVFNSFNFILFKETIIDEEVPDLKYQKLKKLVKKQHIHTKMNYLKLITSCYIDM